MSLGFEEFLAGFPPPVRLLSNYLRELVKRALPQSTERVIPSWQLIAFYVSSGSKTVKVGFILPHPATVSFGFEYGVLLEDEQHAMLGAGERLKRVRYLSYRTERDVNAREARRFTKQAAEVALMPSAMRRHLLGLHRSLG